jgi:hypothetical protein
VRAFQVTINKAVCVRGSRKVVNKMDFPPRTTSTEKAKALGNEMNFLCMQMGAIICVGFLIRIRGWNIYGAVKAFFCSGFVIPTANRGDKMHFGSIKKRSKMKATHSKHSFYICNCNINVLTVICA